MNYSVRTPFLFWFGSGALAFTLFIVVAGWGNWMVVFGLAALFGGCGAALLLMSAEVSGDAERLTVRRIRSEVSVKWEEIERVSEGGGNLVFYTKAGRVTVPSFEFWSGAERGDLLALLQRSSRRERCRFALGHCGRCSMSATVESHNKRLQPTLGNPRAAEARCHAPT